MQAKKNIRAEWEHTILTVNYTLHCMFVFTVKCENGRFLPRVRATGPFSHAVIRVDRDPNETEKHAQLSVTTYGNGEQRRAAACDLCE